MCVGSSQYSPQFLGNSDEGLCGRTIRSGDYNGHATVTRFADFSEKRHFAEERELLALGLGFAPAVAEDFDALARGSGKVAHVFDDAEDGDVDLLEHGNALADHAQRGFLRGRHDHATVQWHSLAERQ